MNTLRRRVSVLTDAEVSFGVIQPEHWYQPEWVDEERATEGRNKLVAQNIIYGGTSTNIHIVPSQAEFWSRQRTVPQHVSL